MIAPTTVEDVEDHAGLPTACEPRGGELRAPRRRRRGRRPSDGDATAGAAPHGFGHDRHDPVVADAPREEGRHRHLVGGVERRRRHPARLARASAPAPTAGNRARVDLEELQRRGRRSAAPAARCPGSRTPSAMASAMGTRMSGTPSCATTAPSTNSTNECTMLRGWMTTSMLA